MRKVRHCTTTNDGCNDMNKSNSHYKHLPSMTNCAIEIGDFISISSSEITQNSNDKMHLKLAFKCVFYYTFIERMFVF